MGTETAAEAHRRILELAVRMPAACGNLLCEDSKHELMNVSNTYQRGNPASELGVEGPASLLEAIVHSSEDAIIAKNLDGIVTSWNPAATRIFGYEPEEIIGQSILKLIPQHLEHQEPFILGKVRAGEQIAHFETERLRKDGRMIFVSLTISPVRDSSDKVIGVSKIARDITEQRQMEIVRARLAAIVESADDAILSKDLNGIITELEPRGGADVWIQPKGRCSGASILKLIPQDLHPEEEIILRMIRAGERIEHLRDCPAGEGWKRRNVSLIDFPDAGFFRAGRGSFEDFARRDAAEAHGAISRGGGEDCGDRKDGSDDCARDQQSAGSGVEFAFLLRSNTVDRRRADPYLNRRRRRSW